MCAQVIQSDGTMWRLVMMDENKAQGLAPPIFQCVLRSNFFHTFILVLVLLDGSIAASLSFNHGNKRPEDKLDEFYFAEVGTAVLVAAGVSVGVCCLGVCCVGVCCIGVCCIGVCSVGIFFQGSFLSGRAAR